MDEMTSALFELANLDELAGGDSFLHQRHPLIKLLLTICYIFLVVSYPPSAISAMVPMVLYPVVLFQMSEIPVRTCFYKLRFVLPLVIAVGIWNPILDRTPLFSFGALTITSGMISFLTLMGKGILSLMASFLLIATTNIEKICYALRLLHVPELLVTQILITYRYISLLLTEASTMVHAYTLRAPGQNGVHISAWGSFLGQLLLRSMDRANHLYQSMEMRGFNGDFTYASVEKPKKADILFGLASLAVLFLLRFINLSEVIGGMIL